jgi:hypothetical protein
MRIDDPFEIEHTGPKSSGVCATDEPMQPGQVFVVGLYRYIVIEEISQREFVRLNRINAGKPAGVSGNAKLEATGAARRENFEAGPDPNFDAKYFYRVRVELERPRSKESIRYDST